MVEINLLLQSAFISGYVQLMSKNMQGSDQITPLKQLAQGTTFFRLLSKVQLGFFREKAHVDEDLQAYYVSGQFKSNDK